MCDACRSTRDHQNLLWLHRMIHLRIPVLRRKRKASPRYKQRGSKIVSEAAMQDMNTPYTAGCGGDRQRLILILHS